MKFHHFEELLIDELQDLYDAENQIIDVLPILQKSVTNTDLKEAFKNHLQETKEQVKRLEKAFKILQADPQAHQCKAMMGMLSEVNEILKDPDASLLQDAALIGAVQKIEHYEIASYGTAHAHAKILDLGEVCELLQETLKEEVNADKKLSKIAGGSFFSSGVNKLASKS